LTQFFIPGQLRSGFLPKEAQNEKPLCIDFSRVLGGHALRLQDIIFRIKRKEKWNYFSSGWLFSSQHQQRKCYSHRCKYPEYNSKWVYCFFEHIYFLF